MFNILINEKGNIQITTCIIIFVILTLSGLIMELYRIHSIQSHVEYELQRAVNIAVEEGMEDSWRQDKYNKLDTERAKKDFYDYLYNDLELNKSYQKIQDGKIIYYLNFVEINCRVDSPQLKVIGVAHVKSIFSFLNEDIEIPFEIRSKNVRID